MKNVLATAANPGTAEWLDGALVGGTAESVIWRPGGTEDTDKGVYITAYCFLVPAGRQYRFVKGGLGGVTENISLYSFIDDKL
jgi:hypothetical protein